MPILSRVPKRAWAVALVFIVGSVIVGSVIVGSVIVGSMRVQTAHAYGSTALWQVGLSFNCDNPSVCGATNLGGFWGWVEFDSGGLGDAELTGCGHLQGGPGGGAQHFSVDITSWTIGSNGDFIVSGTGTNAGHGGGSFPLVDMDTGIPALAGHFSALTIFGMQGPPGTNFEIQVTQLNH
jgi:hypothetical protein